MSDYIKEKVEEVENILIRNLPPVENMPTAILQQEKIDERLDLIEKVSAKIGRIFQSSLQEMEERIKITEDTSDGYHTFKELYEFRKIYNAVLFNEWTSQGKYNVHKSIRHHDGELCFGEGWFIVVADLPTGQISNHYELKDWDLFQCEEREKAEEWDGHTPQDVVNRLLLLSHKKESGEKECTENWKTIPFSSTHLWNGDIHGIATGNCLKCGKSVEEWNKKLSEEWFKHYPIYHSPKKEKRGR